MNKHSSILPSQRDPFSADAQPARVSPFDSPVLDAPTAAERLMANETWDLLDRTVGFEETNEYGESNLALEVVVSWGASVLHVAHLSPPRSFVVGEAGQPEAVDFHLPADVLGRVRLPVVLVEGGTVYAIVPDVAEGVVEQGKTKILLREMMDGAEICGTVTRAKQQRLGAGMHVSMKLPGVDVRVGLVQKSQPIPRGLAANWDWAVPSYFGMTLGLVGALMTSLAYFVPPIGIEDEAALNQDRLLLISQYLESASERERKMEEETPAPESGDDEGRAGEKAQGAEGEAGKVNEERTNKRVAIKGPPDTQTATVSRLEAITLAREFGMVGLLAGANDPNAPMSVFARDLALGPDAETFDGAMFGAEIGESGGMGGLGLSGPGMGGGDLFGDGSGIGMDKWGSLGGGHGLTGGGSGTFGRSGAFSGKGHVAKAPSLVSTGNTIVDGHIPPEVIRRIVRQNFGRFRMCYEQGLGRNPSLEGRIPVRFIVGSDGAVANASASGDFPDAAVKSCVVSAFYGLSFPAPDRGTVKVTYPIMFTPG